MENAPPFGGAFVRMIASSFQVPNLFIREPYHSGYRVQTS